MASRMAIDSSSIKKKICEVLSSDSSETSDCYEDYRDGSSGSAMMLSYPRCCQLTYHSSLMLTINEFS